MSDTPRADHYRKEFARRKDYSDLVRWLLDEFEQTEKRLRQAEGEIQRFTNVYMAELRERRAREQLDPSSPESIMKGRD